MALLNRKVHQLASDGSLHWKALSKVAAGDEDLAAKWNVLICDHSKEFVGVLESIFR